MLEISIVYLMANHHVSNLIFMIHLFSQSHFQSHPKVLHILLILFCFHLQNQKLNIYFHFFFNMSNYFTNDLVQKIYTLNIFIIILLNCCLIDKTFFSNRFMIHVFIVNEIRTNSNVYCKNYWKELLKHNVQCARTAIIFMLIFKISLSYFCCHFYVIFSFSTFFNWFINYFFLNLQFS